LSRVILVQALAPVFVAAGFGMEACSSLGAQKRDTKPIPKDIVV